VDRGAVADLDDEHDHPIVSDLGQNPMAADAVPSVGNRFATVRRRLRTRARVRGGC
jgi:hypothetical protein